MTGPGRIIAWTTDFGSEDTFVGQMKAAALSVTTEIVLVDLTHEVPPHDVEAGAYLLWTGYRGFPPGTIHVAVVDPGVGTERRGIVAQTRRYTFVAPDNGILTRVLEDEPPTAVRVLEAGRYRRPDPSPTFHGRDVFAPAAGWLARGVEPERFGPDAGELVRIERPTASLAPGSAARVRVLVIDRFGNATLDLPRSLFDRLGPGAADKLEVVTPGGVVRAVHRTYADGAGGGPFLVFNSADHVEIALWCDSASAALGIVAGTEVEARLAR